MEQLRLKDAIDIYKKDNYLVSMATYQNLKVKLFVYSTTNLNR